MSTLKTFVLFSVKQQATFRNNISSLVKQLNILNTIKIDAKILVVVVGVRIEQHTKNVNLSKPKPEPAKES